MEPKTSKAYCGVILAAGVGARIRPLSLASPKPMLPVCNKPIIQYQMELMAGLGIEDIFIVCGHLKQVLEDSFEDGGQLGVSLHYVEQAKPLGIAHALAAVEGQIDRPFLLFLGDIFFITRGIHRMIELFEHRNAGGVLAVMQESRQELIKRNYAVVLHESGMVKRVIEKPRYTSNNLKGCGIYLFDLPIFDAVRRTPRTALRDEYEITSSIQILIDDGYPVYPADVIEWDMNITVIEDLVLSNLKMLELSGKDVEIGHNVSLHPGAKIQNSVIGHNSVIEHPITIRNSVVLPEAIIKGREDLSGVLAIEESVIRLGQKDGGASHEV